MKFWSMLLEVEVRFRPLRVCKPSVPPRKVKHARGIPKIMLVRTSELGNDARFENGGPKVAIIRIAMEPLIRHIIF